jgi:hypothetical protein
MSSGSRQVYSFHWTLYRFMLRSKLYLRNYGKYSCMKTHIHTIYKLFREEVFGIIQNRRYIFRDSFMVPFYRYFFCPLFGHDYIQTRYWGNDREYFCVKCYKRHIPKIIKILRKKIK